MREQRGDRSGAGWRVGAPALALALGMMAGLIVMTPSASAYEQVRVVYGPRLVASEADKFGVFDGDHVLAPVGTFHLTARASTIKILVDDVSVAPGQTVPLRVKRWNGPTIFNGCIVDGTTTSFNVTTDAWYQVWIGREVDTDGSTPTACGGPAVAGTMQITNARPW